jgi:hypothetical protein
VPYSRGSTGSLSHREHAEHAFVDPVERLAPDESVERLYPEPELAYGERALATEVP